MTAIDRYVTVCEQIASEGGKVTIEAVRARAGGGSARDVSAAIKAWKGEADAEPNDALIERITQRVMERLAAQGVGRPVDITDVIARDFGS